MYENNNNNNNNNNTSEDKLSKYIYCIFFRSLPLKLSVTEVTHGRLLLAACLGWFFEVCTIYFISILLCRII